MHVPQDDATGNLENFSSKKIWKIDTVALSFVFDKYCPIQIWVMPLLIPKMGLLYGYSVGVYRYCVLETHFGFGFPNGSPIGDSLRKMYANEEQGGSRQFHLRVSKL
jgi:hypothetical protein